MRLAVYTDYVYRRRAGVLYAERAFALFLASLAGHVDRLTLIGRLADVGDARYPLPDEVELAALHYYGTLANPVLALIALVRSLGSMWRALDHVDVIWVLGPYPHAIVLVILARVRRRRVVLGVRQDWPSYVRMRRPGRRLLHLAADAMEWSWSRLARRRPVVAVGSELSSKYRHAPRVLDLTVSLVPDRAVGAPSRHRDYRGELVVLTVGRIDHEKNPLLLADVLASLCARDRRWRMVICGEGDLRPALADRLEQLGVADQATLAGYVPMGEELLDLYRASHMLLHVSWTEGFPQVLIEAFATGLPVVATAVGGVSAGVGDAALLVRPGDATAAADALQRLADDPGLRKRLASAGLGRARELTLEAQITRLAAFLTG